MIALTIALLLTVIIMMDSTAPVMANYATIRGGQQDAIFHLNNGTITNPYSAKFAITNQLFNYSDIADKLELNFCQISFCAARIQMTANTSTVIAVDLAREFSLHFGLQQLESGNVNLSEGLPWNECIISTDFQEAYNFTLGDSITLNMTYGGQVNYTIVGIYDNNDGFPFSNFDYYDVIIDLNAFWQQFPIYNGQANFCSIVLKNQQSYYNFLDTAGSTKQILSLVGNMENFLGINNWSGEYLNLDFFQEASTVYTVFILLLFTFLLVTILFCSNLIYSSVSTALNEQIREFGILQAIGGTKSDIRKYILFYGLILGFGSTLLGLGLGILFSRLVMLPIVDYFLFSIWQVHMPFILDSLSIVSVCLFGFLLTLIISFFPYSDLLNGLLFNKSILIV